MEGVAIKNASESQEVYCNKPYYNINCQTKIIPVIHAVYHYPFTDYMDQKIYSIYYRPLESAHHIMKLMYT